MPIIIDGSIIMFIEGSILPNQPGDGERGRSVPRLDVREIEGGVGKREVSEGKQERKKDLETLAPEHSPMASLRAAPKTPRRRKAANGSVSIG